MFKVVIAIIVFGDHYITGLPEIQFTIGQEKLFICKYL